MTYLFCRANDAEAINEYHASCRKRQSIVVTCLYRRKFANVQYDHTYLPPCDQNALLKKVHLVEELFARLVRSAPSKKVELTQISSEYIRIDSLPIDDAKVAAAEIHSFMTDLIEVIHLTRDAEK